MGFVIEEKDMFKLTKVFLEQKLCIKINHFGVDLKNKVINVGHKNTLITIEFKEFVNWLNEKNKGDY